MKTDVLTAPLKPSATRRFRIGVWCDYGKSFRVFGGIGVFVRNLVSGLLQLDEPIEIVYLAHPGDEEWLLDCHDATHRDRLSIVVRTPARLGPRSQLLLSLTNAWREPSNTVQRWNASWKRHGDSVQRCLRALLRPLARGVLRRRWWAPAAILLTPLVLGLGWAAFGLVQCAAALQFTLLFPFTLLDQLAARLVERYLIDDGAQAALNAARCDVWIIPYVELKTRLEFPAVLFIHDLVTSRFPEMFEPGSVEWLENLTRQRAAEATYCACMSNFIRDTELCGFLGLPREKVRMVPFAPPKDWPPLDRQAAMALKPPQLQRPYFFLPASGEFRGYKNQANLIRAMAVLRDRMKTQGFDLVFTMERAGELPGPLHGLTQALGLTDHVHVLGHVDRCVLAALYQSAQATIIPSLYEQGSFPVYEALHWGCPVACSNIAPLMEQCAALGDAMIYFDPVNPENMAQALSLLAADRDAIAARQRSASRSLWQRTWSDVAREWLPIFREAPKEYYRREVRQSTSPDVWRPALQAFAEPAAKLEAFVFLQQHYLGGVWEATTKLMRELSALEAERGKLRLVLGLAHDQTDTQELERSVPGLPIRRFRMRPIARKQLPTMLGGPVWWLADRPEQEFCFMRGAENEALRADAWFALVDRFQLPLLPARPYGLIVYDMIQRHFPDGFDRAFFHSQEAGIRPTVQHADQIMVTSTATAADVLAEYSIKPERVRLVPLACEPQRRFAGIVPEPVRLPHGPFFLNVANAAAHKGAETLLRGFAQFRQSAGQPSPFLVMCGWRTDRFSPAWNGGDEHDHERRVQWLVHELGLCPGREVLFLGYINDAQLLTLYGRCQAVINAAKYDNGSFSLIEGRYFGRPLVSSCYSAAEALAARFALPVDWFSPDDSDGLAEALSAVCREPSLAAAPLKQVQADLANEEFTYRRYAERVFDMLLELARQGRNLRSQSSDQAA